MKNTIKNITTKKIDEAYTVLTTVYECSGDEALEHIKQNTNISKETDKKLLFERLPDKVRKAFCILVENESKMKSYSETSCHNILVENGFGYTEARKVVQTLKEFYRELERL